jgi:hypothetical protein
MPVTSIDSAKALRAVAAELSALTGVPEKALNQDPKYLDQVLMTCDKFSWDKVGRQLDQSRQQMYRWYHDTH